MVTNVTTSGLAKNVGGLIVDTSRAYSDGGSEKNECSHCISTMTVDRVYAKVWFICDGGRLE